MAELKYLYDQKGPWPQPNPLDDRLFSAVIHLPLIERVQWNLRVGLRYLRQLVFMGPEALIYGLRRPSVELLSDHDFEERFDNTVFNKMIVPFSKTAPTPETVPTTDEPGEQMSVDRTEAVLAERGEQLAEKRAWECFPRHMEAAPCGCDVRYFIADFSIFETLETYPGTYTAGTVALFKRDQPGARLELISIQINGLTLTPEHGDAWALAKLFTIQAASIRLVFATHALLHFPEDSINAISKGRLPTNHVLYQLLIPHTDLQLVLDQAVQTSYASPLMNRQLFPWNAHTGPVAGLVRTAVQLYAGVEDNPAYPAYHYKHPRRTPDERYVNFLEAYYQTILRFVRKVLSQVEAGDPIVERWANDVAAHVPGFPNGDHIFHMQNPEDGVRNLDWAVATFIWDVSVGHTTDHYNMGLLNINENPMRVRVPPPTSATSSFDRKPLRRWADFARYRLFWRMFLTSTTVYRLDKVRYPFTDPELQAHSRAFLLDLDQTDKDACAAGDAYIPLSQIARSVQF